MSDRGAYEIARLDEIERSGNRSEWIPIRRSLDIASFGVNAWAGEEGARLIPEHEESSTGHEELYLVLDGHATFTVAGETIDAPAGTLVFARDPAVSRGAVAAAGGATILSIGAKARRGVSRHAMGGQLSGLPAPRSRRVRGGKAAPGGGRERVSGPGRALYNLACAEAKLGETDAALDHLLRATELEERFAEYAQDDEDLASLRDDPRFPSAPRGQ